MNKLSRDLGTGEKRTEPEDLLTSSLRNEMQQIYFFPSYFGWRGEIKVPSFSTFSWTCYETQCSSLKCNTDDQLSGTVPPNQSSPLAGTMGLFFPPLPSFTLRTCSGTSHRRPPSKDTLSRFVWKR